MEYTYLLVYMYRKKKKTFTATTELVTNARINSVDKIRSLEKKIVAESGDKHALIINFILLKTARKEEEKCA